MSAPARFTPSGAALVLVPPHRERHAPQVSFCSHCGKPPTGETATRVCEHCALGLQLTAAADTAPGPGDAFIVVDSSMAVCAVSAGAERLLATQETDAVNRHLTELVVPADAEASAPENLAVAVTWAAREDQPPSTVTVRPTNTFGVRIRTRIASCGPPRGALLVFD